jgi:hypothetical protein
MSTITVEWWWMLVALALIAVTGMVCGWVAYNWGWSHAAEDVHGRHARPVVPPLVFELSAAETEVVSNRWREIEAAHPDPVVFGGASSVLFELPPAPDDPSITTWTREQAEEMDRAIKAMIADTDTFIAGLGGG